MPLAVVPRAIAVAFSPSPDKGALSGRNFCLLYFWADDPNWVMVPTLYALAETGNGCSWPDVMVLLENAVAAVITTWGGWVYCNQVIYNYQLIREGNHLCPQCTSSEVLLQENYDIQPECYP